MDSIVRVPNWLGDAVLSMPAVQAVRAQSRRLAVVAQPTTADLYDGIAEQLIDATLPRRALVDALRGFRADLTVLLQGSFYSALIARLSGCPEIWGYSTHARGRLLTRPVKPPRDIYAEHQLYYYWRLVRAVGLAKGHPVLRLDPVAGAGLLDGEVVWVGMCPGAQYGDAKRWPAQRYAAVGRALAGRGLRIALFGSDSEESACQAISEYVGPPALNLAGRTSLKQLLASLAQCRVLVTNDSGTLHAASALHVPTVALFGSTEPRSSGPLADRSVVIRRRMPCAPCHRRTCPIDHRCMTWIHPEEVVAAVARLILQSASARS